MRILFFFKVDIIIEVENINVLIEIEWIWIEKC